MSKIAQALHHMPRAYQAISFLPHVVTLLTGWPAEKASKGKQKIFRGIRTARCSLSEEQHSLFFTGQNVQACQQTYSIHDVCIMTMIHTGESQSKENSTIFKSIKFKHH